MHGLDKVAHVSHVPGSTSVRGIGRPASAGWEPGSAPSVWTAGFPRSRRLSCSAHSAAEATLRRHGFGFCRYHDLCFSGLALARMIVRDDRNSCSGPQSRTPGCPNRHEPARSEGFSNPCKTTYPMNKHVCVIPWGSRRRGAI